MQAAQVPYAYPLTIGSLSPGASCTTAQLEPLQGTMTGTSIVPGCAGLPNSNSVVFPDYSGPSPGAFADFISVPISTVRTAEMSVLRAPVRGPTGRR